MKKLFHVLAQMAPGKDEETLVLKMGNGYSSFAVTDVTGKRLYELAYYTADEINNNFLNQLLILHPELNQPFDKAFVSYDYEQNTLIPAQNFKQENASALLNAIYGVGNNFTIISDFFIDNGFYSVYAVPKEIHDWVLQKFPFSVFNHSCKYGIKKLLNENVAGCVRVDFNRDTFNVIVSKEKQILLSQTYSYIVPDDVIYYLLKICQQFSLSSSEVRLILSGLIEKQSNLFHELYQYFINIDFKNAGWEVNKDNEYPLHFFASLNEILQ